MQVSPIKSYKSPDYPLLTDVKENPELLANVPKRWLAMKPLVGASLGFFVLSANGCLHSNNSAVKKSFETIYNNNHDSIGTKEIVNGNESNKESFTIAPIFIHGDGRGAFGCIMINAPRYISEKDALELIYNEFKNHGIKLEYKKEKVSKQGLYAGPIVSNLFSEELNLGVLFIGLYSPRYYGAELGDGSSSVSAFDTKLCSETLQNHIRQSIKTNVVIFYDSFDEYSKENLEKQIEDYFEWVESKAKK